MYKIAVCDDDEIIIQNLHKLCQNYEDVHNTKLILSEYTNPNKLISDLEDGKKFDIFFIDIEMPQMDGHHLTKLIKTNDTMKHIPVVIFSSLVNDEMKRKGEQLGADAQLSKPEIGQLVEAIDGLLGAKA